VRQLCVQERKGQISGMLLRHLSVAGTLDCVHDLDCVLCGKLSSGTTPSVCPLTTLPSPCVLIGTKSAYVTKEQPVGPVLRVGLAKGTRKALCPPFMSILTHRPPSITNHRAILDSLVPRFPQRRFHEHDLNVPRYMRVACMSWV
jgi:hypothetical protein